MRLIQKIESLGVSLAADGNDLLISGNTRALTKHQIEWLKNNKPKIMKLISNIEPMNRAEEKAIRTWCSYIGEQDPELIEEVLSRCDKVIDARHYFLKRSKEAICTV